MGLFTAAEAFRIDNKDIGNFSLLVKWSQWFPPDP